MVGVNVCIKLAVAIYLFLISELVDAVRCTHEKVAGMHSFASISWFQNVYDAQYVELLSYLLQDEKNC